MAITQAMCTSFKVGLLKGSYNFTNTTGDVFNLALFRAQASIVGSFGAATTNYSDMGADEASGTNYVAGGSALTNVTPTSSGTTAFTDFADLVFKQLELDPRQYIEIDPRYFRPAEVDLLLGDCRKATEKLGWTASTSLAQLAQLMVDHDLELARQEKLLASGVA